MTWTPRSNMPTLAAEALAPGRNRNRQAQALVLALMLALLLVVSGSGPRSADAQTTAPAGGAWAWGYNGSGQLGDGTTTESHTPVQVAGLTGAVDLAGGYNHSLALKEDGTAWAWGDNGDGKLGDGTTTNRSTPVRVSGLTGAVDLAGGNHHSLALKEDGTVWAWGSNTSGQLGDDITGESHTPVRVAGLAGVVDVASGDYHSLALKEDGTVWAWGNNQSGQLGNGTYSVSESTPVRVAGLAGAVGVAGGSHYSLALKEDGTVWAWGSNTSGQLGDGTTTESHTPVRVSGLSDVTEVVGSGSHSLAVKGDGTAWAWGYNGSGQLGDGTTTESRTPVRVSGLTGVVDVASGDYHSLALKEDGTAWAWGDNGDGGLGDGTTTNRSTPVRVSGLTGVTAVASGAHHSLAVRGLNGASRTPLIFVPGIGGSELLYTQSGNEEKWPRVNGGINNVTLSHEDAFLRDLKLAENGIGPFGDDTRYITEVGDIVRYKDVPIPEVEDVDAYKTTIETLTREGYVEGENLFLFPFDWRKDVRTARGGSLPDCEDVTLNQFIDCVLERTKAQQVNIMAHSQGGLVTQAALDKQESVGKVNKVLTLGTPFLGATTALGMLQYQSPCFVDTFLGYCPVNPATVQEVFQNFPGAYQLLPSRDFHKVEGSPLIRNNESKSYEYWTGLINQYRNPFLMGYADEYQQAFSGKRPRDGSVEWTQVVGMGKPTPTQIRLNEVCLLGNLRLVCSSSQPEIVMGGGDGTVPLHSADLGAGGANDLTNGKEIQYQGFSHGDLAKHSEVLADANDYFNEVAPSSADASALSAQRTTEESSTGDLAAESPLNETPDSFDGIELESVGAVDGYVEDESGNVLGNPPDAPEDLIVQEIPGGQYNAIQDTQSFFLNQAGSFSSDLEVSNEEGSRLRVRTYTEGEIDGQAVFQVAAPEGSDLEVGFTSGQALADLTLGIDQDGDGTAERQEAPDSVVTGSDASDTTPPEATASFEKLDADDARVTISATDNEGGSGIADIYYSIKGQNSPPRLYEAPFTVPLGSVVLFTATDKAGNTADIKEIPDTTAPTGSVKINKGAAKTKSLRVKLSLSGTDNTGGTGLSSMCVSNTKRCTKWQPYSTTKAWTLSKGKAGTRTVYVRFKDKAGNVSAVYRDAIRYAPPRK